MLPRSTRLSHKDFSLRGYQSLKTPYFLIKAKRNGRLAPRIGAIISSAAVKNAVQRNFLKRQAKHLLLKRAVGGVDILIVFARPIVTLSKKEFTKELAAAYLSLAQKLY